ncbi:MAG: septum formation initiator family protein [Parvibaculaceae bacterium]
MERFGLVSTHEPLRLRLLVLPLVCGALLVYFGVSALKGDQGLAAWTALSIELEELHAELDTVRAERERLEHHVALLRPESLDPDLLDERARASLGIARPDELTIYRDPR